MARQSKPLFKFARTNERARDWADFQQCICECPPTQRERLWEEIVDSWRKDGRLLFFLKAHNPDAAERVAALKMPENEESVPLPVQQQFAEALFGANLPENLNELLQRLFSEEQARERKRQEEEWQRQHGMFIVGEDWIGRLPGGVELSMVAIPAGSFMMGSPPGELGRRNDETLHRVILTQPFWLGKFAVTQGQWKAVMGDNPSKYKQGDSYPVESVRWDDAVAFCDCLNANPSIPKPVGYRFALPTEAQWEYACRAGTTTALNSGRNLTDEKYNCVNLDQVGWYDYKNAESSTHPVGQKAPNAWGLYDMHGNVWEWCRDWYSTYAGDAIDPAGCPSSSLRVSRGGGWCNYARFCRSACRFNSRPDDPGSNLGFRLALVPVS